MSDRLTHCVDSLVVDTGSANTWVGAGKKYKRTSATKGTPNMMVRPRHIGCRSIIDFLQERVIRDRSNVR